MVQQAKAAIQVKLRQPTPTATPLPYSEYNPYWLGSLLKALPLALAMIDPDVRI